MSRLVTLVLIGSLVACDRLPEDPKIEPEIEPVTIAPTAVYAGGTVTLRSEGFRLANALNVWTPKVFADTVLSEVVLSEGDSVVVRVPRNARGSVAFRL